MNASNGASALVTDRSATPSVYKRKPEPELLRRETKENYEAHIKKRVAIPEVEVQRSIATVWSCPKGEEKEEASRAVRKLLPKKDRRSSSTSEGGPNSVSRKEKKE